MDYSDQQKIFDPSTWDHTVHLVGAGGINNLVGLTLAKMGITHNLHVWDDDVLEARNLPTEVGYSVSMCGRPKVAAMRETLEFMMPGMVDLHCHQQRVDANTQLGGIVISGVDSMKSRQQIWSVVKRHRKQIPLFIDGRSGGELTHIFAFDPNCKQDRRDYETWLFDDNEAAPLPCGARNIAYISLYMAEQIGYILRLFHAGRELPQFPMIKDFS